MRAVERPQPGLDVRQPRAPAVRVARACRPRSPRPASSSCRRRRGRRRARARARIGSRRRIISAVIAPWDAAADAEVDVRLGNREVAEEGGAHRGVVVLAGVDQDLGVRASQRAADRRRLHELWARADHGEDSHAAAPRAGTRCRSAGRHRRTACRRRASLSGVAAGAGAPPAARRVAERPARDRPRRG